jgi:hypothetical protein
MFKVRLLLRLQKGRQVGKGRVEEVMCRGRNDPRADTVSTKLRRNSVPIRAAEHAGWQRIDPLIRQRLTENSHLPDGVRKPPSRERAQTAPAG